MKSSALRPKGTVEVRCSVAGCRAAWWVDPLDPRLSDPAHTWDCGADHSTARTVDRLNAELHLRFGIVNRGSGGAGARSCGEGPVGGAFPFHYYRDGRDLSKHAGLLLHEHVGLPAVDALDRIEWDVSRWPEEARSSGVVSSGRPSAPAPGMVHWVGYRDCDEGGRTLPKPRRYTFGTCSRCGHDLYIDVDNPRRKVSSHTVGAYGGGEMVAPAWVKAGQRFVCEDVLSTSVYSVQPCEFAEGPVRLFEQQTWHRWTWWESARGNGAGYIIFRSADREQMGLVRFRGNAWGLGVLRQVLWAPPGDLLALLPDDADAPWELRDALTLLAGGGK